MAQAKELQQIGIEVKVVSDEETEKAVDAQTEYEDYKRKLEERAKLQREGEYLKYIDEDGDGDTIYVSCIKRKDGNYTITYRHTNGGSWIENFSAEQMAYFGSYKNYLEREERVGHDVNGEMVYTKEQLVFTEPSSFEEQHEGKTIDSITETSLAKKRQKLGINKEYSKKRANISINNELSEEEKRDIRTLLKAIDKTGTTLLDNGDGIMYLLDHADKEDIENRNPNKEDGFNCRLKFSTEGLSIDFINEVKTRIENGTIRNQRSLDKWAKSYLNQQGSDNSDSIDAEERAANANNDRLDLEASERESRRGQSYQNSQDDYGTGFVKVYDNDGTINPRYIPINTNEIEFLRTPNGTVYGWAQGNTIHLTKAGLNPNTPVHEFTHLWVKAMQKKDPKFWAECKAELMKSSEWQEVLNDENYADIRGNEDAVASEVLSRLCGRRNHEIVASTAEAMLRQNPNATAEDVRAEVKRKMSLIQRVWDWIAKNIFGFKSGFTLEQLQNTVVADYWLATPLGEMMQEGKSEFSIRNTSRAEAFVNEVAPNMSQRDKHEISKGLFTASKYGYIEFLGGARLSMPRRTNRRFIYRCAKSFG